MSEHKLPKDKKKKIALEKPQKVVKRSAEDIEKMKNLKVPTRRVKMLMVNPADFVFLFTKGLRFRKNYQIIEGVPEDAKVLTAVADSARNGIMIVVQSDSYDEIPYNVMPPTELVSIDMAALSKPAKKEVKRKKK